MSSTMTAVLSALADLTAQDPHELTDSELGEQLVLIERAARMVEGARAGTLAVFDGRQAGAADNALSTAAWLRHRCQLGHGRPERRQRRLAATRRPGQ